MRCHLAPVAMPTADAIDIHEYSATSIVFTVRATYASYTVGPPGWPIRWRR